MMFFLVDIKNISCIFHLNFNPKLFSKEVSYNEYICNKTI